MAESAYIKLVELLRKKASNEKQVPIEVLNTKYKAAYDDLKSQICKAIGEVLPSYIFSGIRFADNDHEESTRISEEMKRIFVEETKGGFYQRLKEVAFKTCDADEVLRAATTLRNRLIYEVYGTYWVSHCKKINAPGFSYYNDIINMWYSDDQHQWMCVGENHTIEVAVYYPPTMEALNNEYENEKKTA